MMQKKWSFLIVIFFLTISCYSQDSIHPNGYNVFYYPNGEKSSEGTLVNGQPEGWWKSYSEQGILLSEGNRKNYLLDSVWTFYNLKGEKTLEINYSEGKKNGNRIQYFENEYVVENWHFDTLRGSVNTYHVKGWLKKTTPYEDGLPHGMEKELNDTGLVVMIARYYRGVLTHRESINRIDRHGLKQGNWKYFWDNGHLKMEATYLNDKKNGFFKYYDENGNFLSVEKYENDELITDAKETKVLERKVAYHANGQPSIIATYYKGIPEGIRREFDSTGNIINGYLFENGWLRYEGVTDLNGKRQGWWKEYYKTGELRSEGKYKNSMSMGSWVFYFPNKRVEITGAYNNKGQKDGEWQWFYPNGELMVQENWVNGELDGEYIEYDEEGNIISKGVYVEDAEEGEWFYKRGTVTEKGSYYDGMRIGLWETWFQDGKPAFEINFDQDLMHGKYTSYWENGNIKLTGKYVTGLRDGVWSKYDEEGNLFLTTVYKDGKEVKWGEYVVGE